MSHCKYCFTTLTQSGLKVHMRSYHESDNFTKCPYGTLFNDFCPIGCKFKACDRSNMRQHLLLFHSGHQLKLWSISK